MERDSQAGIMEPCKKIGADGQASCKEQADRRGCIGNREENKQRNSKKARTDLMKVVIDSNRAIAALIKDSTTRKILFDDIFEFVAPSHIMVEINSYKDAIIQKIGITESEFDILSSLIFQHIEIIPQEEYDEFIAKMTSSPP